MMMLVAATEQLTGVRHSGTTYTEKDLLQLFKKADKDG